MPGINSKKILFPKESREHRVKFNSKALTEANETICLVLLKKKKFMEGFICHMMVFFLFVFFFLSSAVQHAMLVACCFNMPFYFERGRQKSLYISPSVSFCFHVLERADHALGFNLVKLLFQRLYASR